MTQRATTLIFIVLTFASIVHAHDTWVQTNASVVRTRDSVFVDLMLGNHGNEHRDFKLAGKIDLENCTLEILAPDGERYDMKDRLVDTGYTPSEGFWQGRFATAKPGLYTVAHTRDTLRRNARSIKSGKTYFVASEQLDRVSESNPGFEKPLGHALEIVPTSNPVTPMGPGQSIAVQVLYEDKPLAGARISFIPRGATLSGEFDKNYERMTGEDGRASYQPKEGNHVLVVAHHTEPDRKGEGYDRTNYSATLTVLVPAICPCCD